MGEYCINGCWSGAWGEDGVDGASGVAGLVRVEVKLPVQGLACAGEASSLVTFRMASLTVSSE